MDSESVSFEKDSVHLPKFFPQQITFFVTRSHTARKAEQCSFVTAYYACPQTRVLLIKKKRKIKVLHPKLVVFAKETYFIMMDNSGIIFLLLIIAISLGWNLTKPEL